MNQQCKVCGEPAAGFHFGAFTCEGCKSFFGRTYNNLGSITECKNNGECVINKKNRTACKACRLRKCLLVGMSKSGSRYGRRSNWFKIHCLLQEQSQNGSNGLTANLFGSPPAFFPSSFLPTSLLSPDKLFPAPSPLHPFPRPKDDPANRSDSGDSSLGDPDDESRSSGAPPFLRPPSSHKTPSPLPDKPSPPRPSAFTKLSPFAPLNLPTPPLPCPPATAPTPTPTHTHTPTTAPLFFPPSHPSPNRLMFPVVTKPGATPAHPHLLGTWPPPANLLLCTPALGGVAVEQDHPIDLSLKTSVAYSAPPTPVSNHDDDSARPPSDRDDDDLTIDVDLCADSVLKNNPLDLTAKRLEVPQSG